jgi:creatinine amidohydrolase
MVNITSPVSWAAKSAPEVRQIAEQDGSILVVPVGSLEQHGDHLPTGTDTILVETVATRGAEQVADDLPVLMTPTLWAGYSPHHLPFGGTVTSEFDTLHEQLEEVAASALEIGFYCLLLGYGHGGNRPLISAATDSIGQTHPDAEIMGLTYFELAGDVIEELRESDPGGMAHGGELETSMLLHLHPELVDEELMAATPWESEYDLAPTDLLGSGPLSVTLDVEEWSETGAMGDVSAVSAEKGEQFVTAFVDEFAALLRTIHE